MLFLLRPRCMSGFRRSSRVCVAAVCTAALALSGCSSWDTAGQGGLESTNGELVEELRNSEGQADPRSLRGVSVIEEFDEVEPVTEDAQPALPVQLTDHDGFEVEVTDVSRIVALDIYGTYTKTLRGLGLGESIVGRTSSSAEESLAHLPVITQGGHDINVEAVLSLRPTLVIVDHSIGPASAIDQIRDAGVTTVVMSPDRSLEGMDEGINNVAGVVGLPEEGKQLADRSMREYEEALEAIKGITPDEPLRMAFLYARGDGGVFYVLGEEASTDDLIGGLGGRDVASENGIGAPSPANAEALAELNPEVFIMMSAGLESTGNLQGLLTRPGVAQTTAGKNQRIIALPDGDSLAFGPQTGEMLLRAAHALYLDHGETL